MAYLVKSFDKNNKIFRGIPKKKPAHFVDYDIRIANEAVSNAVEKAIEKLGVLFLSDTKPLDIGDGDVVYSSANNEITVSKTAVPVPFNFFGLDFNSPSSAFTETLPCDHTANISDRRFGIYLSFPATQKISSEKVDASYGEYFSGISKVVDDNIASVVNQIPGPTLVTYEGFDFVTLGDPSFKMVSDSNYQRVDSSNLVICRLFTITVNADETVSIYNHYAPRYDSDIAPYLSGREEITLEDYVQALKNYLGFELTSQITTLTNFVNTQISSKASLAGRNVFTGISQFSKREVTYQNISTNPLTGNYVGATAKSFVTDLTALDVPSSVDSEDTNFLFIQDDGFAALQANSNHVVLGPSLNTVSGLLTPRSLVLRRIFRHPDHNPSVNGGIVLIEIDLQHVGTDSGYIEIDNDHICASSNLVGGGGVGIITFQTSRLVQNKAYIIGTFENEERFRIIETSAYPGEVLYKAIQDVESLVKSGHTWENVLLNSSSWEDVPNVVKYDKLQVTKSYQNFVRFRGQAQVKSNPSTPFNFLGTIQSPSNRPKVEQNIFLPDYKDFTGVSPTSYGSEIYVLHIRTNGEMFVLRNDNATITPGTIFNFDTVQFFRFDK